MGSYAYDDREKMSAFIGVRLLPEQRRKLGKLGARAGAPGNISAGLRWLVDHAAVQGRTVMIIDDEQPKKGASA